jgi:predicted GNAT family acetyltransferase
VRYRPSVLVRRFDDPSTFREAATPFLVRDEARHNLILGLMSNLVQTPPVYELFDLWLVSDDDDVAGAALRTPPFNLVMAEPVNTAALDALVDRLLDEGQELPGVVAAVPELDSFVSAWTAANGVDATVVLRQGIYELRDVLPFPAAGGTARPATLDDRDLVLRWMEAFADEALPEKPESDRQAAIVESRLQATDSRGIWLWEDGGAVVSMSGYGPETPNGIRIGPVYTPPEHRGRGYATTLVADQSRWLLNGGRSFCYLYTDLDNPTSNALYRRIGYRLVAESAEVRFDPKAAA